MAQPQLVYDDECEFCTRAARCIDRHAAVTLIPFSAVDDQLQDTLPSDWEDCVHLCTEETVYSCGEAMVRAYELTDLPGAGVVPYLRRLPGWSTLREAGYRLVAANRSIGGRLLR